MGRTLNEMIDALPKQRRERIDARYRELKDEVESLSELRKAAGKAQADIAATLKIKQPSVSKIEGRTACICRLFAATSKRSVASLIWWSGCRPIERYGCIDWVRF